MARRPIAIGRSRASTPTCRTSLGSRRTQSSAEVWVFLFCFERFLSSPVSEDLIFKIVFVFIIIFMRFCDDECDCRLRKLLLAVRVLNLLVSFVCVFSAV